MLLGLVVGLSMSWSFTEEWGEYFALVFWATVGMMLLTAAEELVTLFLTLEMMTICLYLSTALEKTRRRSAEGGLKYFVYGSVSSALFLFGLSMLYGMTGTTQLDAIYRILHAPTETRGLAGNVAGATAVLLMLVGFGFKVAAVPFHQWAPDAYEGAPAPVAAWIATGSKLASFVALMKVFLHALLPWSNPSTSIMGPGWIGDHRRHLGGDHDLRQLCRAGAAKPQANAGLFVNCSRRLHPGWRGGRQRLPERPGRGGGGPLLSGRLCVRERRRIRGRRLAGPRQEQRRNRRLERPRFSGAAPGHLHPGAHVVLDRDSPLAGFFGKLYLFMEALNQDKSSQHVTLIWLVALALFNSVVSAFYYVRVLKAMFLRQPGSMRLAPASRAITLPIVLGTLVVVMFGIMPDSLMRLMQAGAATHVDRPGSQAHFERPLECPGAAWLGGRSHAEAGNDSAKPVEVPARAKGKRRVPGPEPVLPSEAIGKAASRKAATGAPPRNQENAMRARPGPATAVQHNQPRKTRSFLASRTRRHGHGHHQHSAKMPG